MGRSKLRPTLHDSDAPGLGYAATYFRVFEAVAGRRQLLHGKLTSNGEVCAIGAYFRQSNKPIDSRAIEEIAAYNDSFPYLTMRERWKKVRRWLKFELARLSRIGTSGDP